MHLLYDVRALASLALSLCVYKLSDAIPHLFFCVMQGFQGMIIFPLIVLLCYVVVDDDDDDDDGQLNYGLVCKVKHHYIISTNIYI